MPIIDSLKSSEKGSHGSSQPKVNTPIALRPGEVHEFYVDVLELEVKNEAWSIDLWFAPAKGLVKGEYEFRGAVSIANCDKDNDGEYVWSSNAIVITKD